MRAGVHAHLAVFPRIDLDGNRTRTEDLMRLAARLVDESQVLIDESERLLEALAKLRRNAKP